MVSISSSYRDYELKANLMCCNNAIKLIDLIIYNEFETYRNTNIMISITKQRVIEFKNICIF